ncbi:phosphate transport system protein [Loktanella sp. DSM 29012]|uniref:Phosphate-specific transport system accessory protein PhoU n=1 Tax=Loktanella gaetbuli TaxID=2881335 RepID=A0ABS8BR79_9RHOB|nr:MULTISPECIES: phosphate signaling complex protein PhoU [Loktanella]KQI67223.1 PhoU family transcriptional regulator [Loktanella sp. 3ANDIMAR09]MCB5198046.1 phosphate signaling complex protein PhoU [Loktanella gaetbuli]SEQ23459.1 phosphate transport system protein [Loktanella sp. DSM 29012]
MSDQQHISSAYDRDLEEITTLIMKMGGMVEAAILQTAEAMATRDLELAEKVRNGDKAIDALEIEINDSAARTIALRAPVSKDLRSILTVLRLAASLERIGDYAKNIAKRTSVLIDMPVISGSEVALKRMAREVQGMLNDTLDAYIRGDAELAEDVRQHDQDVDQMYNALFREFLTFMMEDPRNITACMHLHFMAKNIERMGDLTTNMAEQVIYLVTGDMPDEARPKSDRTAYTTEPE